MEKARGRKLIIKSIIQNVYNLFFNAYSCDTNVALGDILQKILITIFFSRPVTDSESLDDQAKMAEFFSSPLVERIVPGRKLSTDVVTPPAKRKILRELEQSYMGYAWASPSEVMTKRVIEDIVVVPPGPIEKEMDDCLNMDFGATSPISLDYGLVSPKKKVWSSPPQRIGRAQNREWSSPHRIIDHPNPENSPGNWISVKESHFTVQRPQSPSKCSNLIQIFCRLVTLYLRPIFK